MYAPGGSLPVIKPISSPVARFDSDAVKATAAVPQLIGKSSTLTMHSSNLAKGLLDKKSLKTVGNVAGKLIKSFKSVAPVLGPTLGVVSSLLGFIPGLSGPKGPSPQDILNEVGIITVNTGETGAFMKHFFS